MDLDVLREQICASLALRLPQAGNPARLVDECLASARKTLRDEFIASLGADAWAKITIIYYKHFLDTGCDISIGEIFSAVLRDSLNTSRMDMVTLQLAQYKLDEQQQRKKAPTLTLVKDGEPPQHC
ncbi:MAG: hypothetical protein JNJ60_04255 [Rhodocyclaceae bacterium]|nr:hypothetical protein [Rhodocyclaceae bacterium]